MPLERLRSRCWDGVGPGVNKLFTVAKPRYLTVPIAEERIRMRDWKMKLERPKFSGVFREIFQWKK